MPIVISFANMKGGVGKTTLCVNLGFQLLLENHKVLIVDNDPQFNATTSLIEPKQYIEHYLKANERRTIYDVYEKPPGISSAKRESVDPKKFFHRAWFRKNPDAHLDILASRIELYETLRNPSHKEYLLDKFLSKYASNYDYILIDCPPTPSILTLSAFAASDFVLIAVQPGYYSALGLPQFLSTLSTFKSDLHDGHKVKALGVIFTLVDRKPSPESDRSIGEVEKALGSYEYKIPVFKSQLSRWKVFEKTLWQARPVQMIQGKGTGSKDMATAELAAIVKETKETIAKLKVVAS